MQNRAKIGRIEARIVAHGCELIGKRDYLYIFRQISPWEANLTNQHGNAFGLLFILPDRIFFTPKNCRKSKMSFQDC